MHTTDATQILHAYSGTLDAHAIVIIQSCMQLENVKYKCNRCSLDFLDHWRISYPNAIDVFQFLTKKFDSYL